MSGAPTAGERFQTKLASFKENKSTLKSLLNLSNILSLSRDEYNQQVSKSEVIANHFKTLCTEYDSLMSEQSTGGLIDTLTTEKEEIELWGNQYLSAMKKRNRQLHTQETLAWANSTHSSSHS
jgi:hypothetical protein